MAGLGSFAGTALAGFGFVALPLLLGLLALLVLAGSFLRFDLLILITSFPQP
jgi:hypothetical protein